MIHMSKGSSLIVATIGLLVGNCSLLSAAPVPTVTYDPLQTTTASDGAGTWNNTVPDFSNGSTDIVYSGTTTATAAYALGATTITVANINGFQNGEILVGTGLPAGDQIQSITAGTGTTGTITLTAATTAAGALNTSIAPYNNVVFGAGTAASVLNGVTSTVTVTGTQTANNLTINADGTNNGSYAFTGGTIVVYVGSTQATSGIVQINANTTIGSVFNSSGGNAAPTTEIQNGTTLTLTGGGSELGFVEGLNGTTVVTSGASTGTVLLQSGTYNEGGNPGFNLGTIATNTGGVVISGTASVLLPGTFGVGSASGVQGLLTINSATASLAAANNSNTSTLYIGRNGGTGKVIISAGSITNNALVSNAINIAGTAGTTTNQANGTLDIQGGTVTTNATIGINSGATSNGSATLSIEGGTLNAGTLAFGAGTTGYTATGTGTLTQTGGTIYLGQGGMNRGATVTGTFTPAISLSGGVLGASNNWSSALAMTLGAGETIQTASSTGTAENIALGGIISGSNGLTETGGGTLTLNGANTYTGVTTIKSGTLALSSSAGASQTVAPLLVTGATSAASASGVNTITLTAANITALGLVAGQGVSGTGIAAGTTISSISGTTITLSANTTATVASGATLNFTLVPSAALSMAVVANAPATTTTLTFGSLPTGLQVGMIITGTDIVPNTYITAINGNTVTLSTTLSSGTTSQVNTGTIYTFGAANQVEVSSSTGIASGQTATITNITGTTDVVESVPGGGNIVTLTSNLSSLTAPGSATSFSSYAGTLGATSAVVLGDATANTSGVLQLGDSNGAVSQTVTSLTTAGTGTANAVVGGNAATSTLTVANTAADTYTGMIGGTGTNQNNVALNVSGSAPLTLTAANTYTGPTTISSTLIANNTGGSATGSGAVAINSGGILGGTGTIAGLVTLNSGGVINPAVAGNAAPATLALNGGLTWNGNSTLQLRLMDVSGVLSSDSINLNGGTLTEGTLGTFTFNFASTTGVVGGDTFALITNIGTDTFNLADLTATGEVGTFSISNNSLDFTVAGGAVVPEPSTVAMMIAGLLLVGANQRRKASARA